MKRQLDTCMMQLIVTFALAVATVSGAQPAPSAELPDPLLTAASNEALLWIAVGELDPATHIILSRMAFLERTSVQLRPLTLPAQQGRIARMAAVGSSLHAFYSSGAHYRYTRSSDRREIRLPGGIIPEAMAGEPLDPVAVLWAVVPHRTGEDIEEAWQQIQDEQATRPSASEDDRLTRMLRISSTRPATTYQLVSYQGGTWQPGFPAIATCTSSERMWLCVAQGRHHLFWQSGTEDPQIQYAWYEKDHWQQGPSIVSSQPARAGFAAVINNQVRFAAIVPISGAKGLRAEAWVRQEPEGSPEVSWTPLPGAKNKDGSDLAIDPGSTICLFGEDLVFLRRHEKQAEVGFWRMASGQMGQAFRDVPLRGPPGENANRRGIREFTATLVVAVLLVLVFWRRQESLANPVALPPGVSVVRPAKRATAALLDMLPSGLLVAFLWRDAIARLWQEMQALSPSDQMNEVIWPPELVIAWIVFCAIYTVYCTVFEIILAKTPGKLLLGAEVATEKLTRPSKMQIVVRNLSRMLELEPHLQIWPFLLVIFLTRNRQRIGDLLARTIVVEKSKVYRELDEGGTA